MKKSHIIGIVIIAVAIAVIFGSMLDASTYSTFTKSATYPDKKSQVIVQLNKEKDMVYNPIENPNLFKFYGIDNDGLEKLVLFNGAKPEQFERSEQIVLTGKMKEDYFIASKILMKCPSKYNDQPGMQDMEVTAIE